MARIMEGKIGTVVARTIMTIMKSKEKNLETSLTLWRLTTHTGVYRTPNLWSCILYIYSTTVGTEYFKHGIYSPF